MRDIKYIIKRVIIGILISLSIMFLKSNVFALTTKTVFSDSSLSNSNKFNYGYLSGGVETTAIGTIGTNVSRASTGLTFFLSENVVLNKTYTLKINFTGDDLYKSFSSNGVVIQSCYGDTCNDSVIVSMTKQSTTARSTYVIFKFNPTSVGSYLRVNLHGSSAGVEILGPVSFGISSVQIESTNVNQDIIDNQTNNTNNIINNQNSNTQEIIDNQTNNTQDIINNQNTNNQNVIDNQNQNTQDIIDNQNSNTQSLIDDNKNNFQTCRDSKNLFNEEQLLDATGWQKQNNIYYGNINEWYKKYRYGFVDLSFKDNTQYTLSFKGYTTGGTPRIKIVYTDDSSSTITISATTMTSYTMTTTTGKTISSIQADFGSGSTQTLYLTNIQLEEGTIATSYEPYGEEICTNKIDDTNQKLDELNNSINDDNIDDDKVNNSLNNISIPQTSLGPFEAFLTIPLQWVQSLLSSNQSCQILHLPLPFLNTYLDLPCMSDFWASTGLLGTLLQACWICVVAVRIFNGLFLLTVDVLNPNPESASQLTKIKTWEL